MQILNVALMDLQRTIWLKKTMFVAGSNGLQSYRACAMESYLRMVVKQRQWRVDTSEKVAESHGFAAKLGGWNLRRWTCAWIKTRTLPSLRAGKHAKVFLLLDDPAIKAELRTYVQSHKWAMNPDKLKQFTQGQLIPSAANKYLLHLVCEEMPRGLQKYMEIELFPCLHLKVGSEGISLSTARHWLRSEGCRFISHKKGLYFDGHDCPDVIAYRQKEFLPAMAVHAERLIKYTVGDVNKECIEQPKNFVERQLVLVAHDEMTSQANDDTTRRWVFEDQHALRKKGVGRGIHQSDVICSTFGWIPEASQTLEYGKNYEGYWTGELFVKQVMIIIR